MKKGIRIALATLLCAGVSVPATAQGFGDRRGYRDFDRFDRFDHIGTVEFDYDGNRERQSGNFGGPVEAIRLEARDSAVQCRNVRVMFGNGRSRNVFDGRLPERRGITIDLPGDDRNIRRVVVDCRSLSPYGSRVDIAADIGRYREAWQRHPDFDRFWRDRFGWARDRRDRGNAGWVPLGVQRFEGRRDSEASFPGRRGRQTDSIALRPINADARCRRVTATFGNGRSRDLDIGPYDFLAQDRLYRIELPGYERNIERIDMTCRAVGEPGVTMQVLASR